MNARQLIENDTKAEILADPPRPRIRVSYEMNPVGDGENGERGWIEEEGVDMTPDEFDQSEGKTCVEAAIHYLENERGDGMYASASFFHPGIWYSTRYDSARHDYHLKDFSPLEEEEVYKAMTS